jgi:hypothetical protein
MVSYHHHERGKLRPMLQPGSHTLQRAGLKNAVAVRLRRLDLAKWRLDIDKVRISFYNS